MPIADPILKTAARKADQRTSTPVSAAPTLLAKALREVEELADTAGATTAADWAREARARLQAGEIWLVVVGQFKRGKSSLINALLGRALLPTGVVPVTSVATVVRHGHQPAATVHLRDGSELSVPSDDLAAFVTEAGNPNNAKGVERVEVGVPSPLLANGLVLVDTPGIGSVSRAATEHAYDWIPRVDAALVVLSPDPPLGSGEAEYLSTLAAATRHVLFAFNKVDLYPEAAWREALGYNRRTVSRLLDVPEGELEFLPTSADPHGSDDSDDPIRAVREHIRGFVEQAGDAAALDACQRRLSAAARVLHEHLALQRAALTTPAKELQERLEDLATQKARLERSRNEAVAVLEGDVRRLLEEVADSLQGLAATTISELEELIRTRVSMGVDESNTALAGRLTEEVRRAVIGAYEAWAAGEGDELRAAFRGFLVRAADTVDGAVRELRTWTAERFGVEMGPPPPLREMVDSSDFYYRIDALEPRTTWDFMAMALPRRWYRARVRRRAGRLAAWELERNAGRLRGDLQYRVSETVRRFMADLSRSVEEYRAGLEDALRHAAAAHAEGEASMRAGVATVDLLLDRLESVEAAGATAP